MINLLPYCTQSALRKGERLLERKAIFDIRVSELPGGMVGLQGKTTDLFNFVDHPEVTLDADRTAVVSFRCGCPDGRTSEKLCEHCAALVLAAQQEAAEA